MKIAYLLDDTLDKPDGVQQSVITIGEHMRSLGHEVHYIVAYSPSTKLQNVHGLAKTVSLKFNANSVRVVLPVPRTKLRRFLSAHKFDVVHVQLPLNPFFSGRIIKLLPVSSNVVGTWHTFPSGKIQILAHKPLSWIIVPILKKFSTTIGVSKPTAEFADQVYRTKSIVIPNAVDISRFQAGLTADHSRSDRKKIVYLGRFDKRKGPQYLIWALSSLKASGYDMSKFDVVMAGKGPELDKCKRLTQKLGLSINYLGFVEESGKPSLLASADICVFPSTSGEAFGISVVEAMASGNSVVLAGDNPGYRSILGKFGDLMFNPLSTDEFASKLKWAIELDGSQHRNLTDGLATEAYKYDVSKICDQLLRVYSSNV